MNRILVISVKPEFVEKIFSGEKTIELRKSSPKVEKGDMVLIYSTTPVKAVIGICRVKEVIKMEPRKIWSQHSGKLGIDKKRFMEYYDGRDIAIGIVLKERKEFSTPIHLDLIRKKIKNFNPPQTFRYLDKIQLSKIL